MPMPEAAKNQNPQDIVCSVNQKAMTGAMGTYLEITPDSDALNVERGPDGSVVFSDVPGAYFTVKVSVSPTSDFNDVLQDCLSARRGFVFDARDIQGRFICTSPYAKVQKQPVLKFGDKVQANEWALVCTYGKYEVRGSKAAV